MKILLITSIYPIPDNKIIGSTSVCHYFAKEWIKMGHEVVVINTYTIYFKLFHWISKFLGKTIANKFPVSINTQYYASEFQYNLDNVPVLLIPTYKPYPKSDFKENAIEKTSKSIINYLKTLDFTPDIITSHFIHPNLELLPHLKKTFPNVPSGISLHGKILSEKRINQIDSVKGIIDFWGFRSYPIANSFKQFCFPPLHSLFCFSGVPESFIKDTSWKKQEKKHIDSFLFVGNLNKRKHPLSVLNALTRTERPFQLNYIGVGKQSKYILNATKSLNSDQQVHLLGRLPRAKVSDIMLNTECFIMISEDETFGLVYLEAMANGCIVIASKDEGMDGIIIDGQNGFLCEAGNESELLSIINHINNLTPEQKVKISQNAIKTATEMTDIKMAKSYINALTKIANNK